MVRPWSGPAVPVVGACLALAALLVALGVPPAVQGTFSMQPVATPRAGSGEPRQAGRELLLQATLERTASDPVALQLLRMTLEPGGASPPHAHPGLELGPVEAGQLMVRVEGRAVVLPAVGRGQGDSQPLPEGVDVTLQPGDRIAYAPGTLMTFRNPGPEPTSLLAVTLLPAGPGAAPGAVYPGGTPGPDDLTGVESRILGEAVVESLPEGRSAVTLERLTLGAGSSLPAYAGPFLLAVEAGGLAGAVVTDGREARAATPVATPAADEAAGVRLSAGQSIFLPRGMAETPPLRGEGTVVLLRLGLHPLGEATGTPSVSPVPAESSDEVALAVRPLAVVTEAKA